ncbi:MAG: Asp-tRNA(Asn)/Glu-tRNA(Gln) amidotransferase subunit GatC [Sphingobacteriia bacterium]|nr:Asp-tRNA(Asn)/Glu-tRNA(Gln) amidotransferase subunit GatC [Sphingobacteriia bacterium]
MEVTQDMINNLSHLARLNFTENEKLELEKDLTRMISFVEQLNEVNTAGIEPMLHMGNAANMLREDVQQGSVSREEALLNAPESDNEFFIVPKVIKK